jgi:hypothetical protein
MTMVAKSLHALLHTIVDYAGLFPPASLTMDAAVANYASYRRDAHAWMLGRFVVPVARIEELARAAHAARAFGEGEHPWRLSALVGEDQVGDAAKIAAFNAASHGALVDAAEVKASREEDIARIARTIPRDIKVYVEIPVNDDPRGLIAAIAAHKLRAKIRTGGVVPEAFPPVDHIARFIRECYAVSAGFKATAGLHHPLRSERALTYQENSPRGVMHGFLNVFLAAAFQYNGLTRGDALGILQADTLAGVTFSDTGLTWKDYVVTLGEIATVRRRFAVAFGSCSFREPVDDLKEIGLLT